MRTPAEARGRSLLVLLVMVWAASWPAIKVGVSGMPPVWFACLRYVVATVCGFGFAAVRGELRRPSPSDWRLVAVSGVLQMAAYSALTAVALTRLPPGRASVLAFSTPLWVAPLSAWWLDEPLTWRTLAGVGTGLAGVLVVVGPTLRQGERRQLALYALLLCGAAAWAVSIVFVRAHRFQSSALALRPGRCWWPYCCCSRWPRSSREPGHTLPASPGCSVVRRADCHGVRILGGR